VRKIVGTEGLDGRSCFWNKPPRGSQSAVVAVLVAEGSACSADPFPLPQPATRRAVAIAAAARVIFRSRLAESALDLIGAQAVDLDNLAGCGLTTYDTDRPSRNLEQLGEERAESGVRPAALGRGRHARLPAVAVPPDELAPRGAR